MNLLARMLKKNPQERITAVEALNHPYFASMDLESYEEERDVMDVESIK